jgi:integrase
MHKVKVRLADGTPRTYYYAWRGGPRLPDDPNSDAFADALLKARASRRQAPPGILFTIIAEYRASADFTSRAPATRKDYGRYLRLIEDAFGTLPIEALSDPAIRGEFKAWRDTFAATPRKADMAWTVLARVMSFAKDRGRIPVNPCERGGRLYRADRAEAIWTEAHIAAFITEASPPLCDALVLALWTGQRQGDLVRLPWSAYADGVLRLRQSKGGRRVAIPAGGPLRAMLDAKKKTATTILTNAAGHSWTQDGFRASWRKATARAGIVGLTFHDLRGSAVTRLAIAGATVPEIAAITGHSLKDVEGILDAHYLGRDQALAEAAIVKLERAASALHSTPK